MFTNLIESDSHVREFKRRSSFFLATVCGYAVMLFAAGIASIYAYDARLEEQNSGLEILNWVPPITPASRPQPENQRQAVRRMPRSDAPIDRTATRPERTEFVSRPDDPTHVPEGVGVKASPVPAITDGAILGPRNINPPVDLPSNSNTCIACSTATTVKVDTQPPVPPAAVKPLTQKLTSFVLASKAVSLPQPLYPIMAKQTRTQGAVNVQILVDEQGKVISAQAVSGNPLLTPAAREAALRARFTPTLLNGQPVKVQGVITYNFVLQ